MQRQTLQIETAGKLLHFSNALRANGFPFGIDLISDRHEPILRCFSAFFGQTGRNRIKTAEANSILRIK